MANAQRRATKACKTNIDPIDSHELNTFNVFLFLMSAFMEKQKRGEKKGVGIIFHYRPI